MSAIVGVKQIRDKALELLKATPDGIHYSELIHLIKQALPDAKENTIYGAVWDLDKRFPKQVNKPARGLFKYISSSATDKTKEVTTAFTSQANRGNESLFYDSFRDYLRGELGDSDNAITMGGAGFGDKWSTPDVLVVRKSGHGAIVALPTEITSAEIKVGTSTQELITGFGQACAYLLFSNKSYLVIPKQTNKELLDRLDALCQLFGIGLILFNKDNSNNPDFQIRNRAVKHDPDMFYVNEYLNKLTEQQRHDLEL